MNRILFLVFGLGLFFPAPELAGEEANDAPAPFSDTILSGKISPRAGWRPKVYIVKPLNYKQLLSPFEGEVVDSAEVSASGGFAFPRKNWLTEKGLYRISVFPEKAKWRNGIEFDFQENIALLVLSGEGNLKIEANVWEFSRSYKLQNPSPENAAIAKIRNFKYWVYQQAETDLAFLPANPDALKFYEKPAATYDLAEIQDTAFKARIEARIHALKREKASLKAFLDTTRMVFPFFVALQRYNRDSDYPTDGEFYLKLANRFSIAPPPELAAWLAEFRQRVRKFQPALMVGDTLPDFRGVSEKGDSVWFSEIAGKVRLLYFWQSGRKACRDFQAKTLPALRGEFSGKGLKTVGYSFDNEEVKWKAALSEDSPGGTNLRDPNGRRSDLVYDFSIKDWPTVLLIDASGKVLARDVFGEELRLVLGGFLGP